MPKGVVHPSVIAFLTMMRAQDETVSNAPRVAKICAAIGVAERTLRLRCQEHLGMSPYRFLWLHRMQQVRLALAEADPKITSVTEVAGNHGFTELGRFSVAYRNLFGESPSTTLRRLHSQSSCDSGMTSI